MRLLLTRKPGENRVEREGYVIPMGEEAYNAMGYEVADAINSERGKNSVLYMPIRDGGKSFGRSLERSFGELNVPYLRLPFFVSKRLRLVLSPTEARLAESISRLKSDRHYGVTAVIYDDTVDKGTRLLLTYGFLIDRQEDPRFHVDDIILTSSIDSRGLTDHQALLCTDKKVDRDDALEELRSKSLITHLAETIYDSMPIRMPEPQDVVRRVMML